jgi:hypothetical protein
MDLLHELWYPSQEIFLVMIHEGVEVDSVFAARKECLPVVAPSKKHEGESRATQSRIDSLLQVIRHDLHNQRPWVDRF